MERYGSGSRGGFSSGPREMHDATCAECGKETEVPFEPDGKRPVYCRDCFQKHKKPRRDRYGGGGGGYGGGRGGY